MVAIGILRHTHTRPWVYAGTPTRVRRYARGCVRVYAQVCAGVPAGVRGCTRVTRPRVYVCARRCTRVTRRYARGGGGGSRAASPCVGYH